MNTGMEAEKSYPDGLGDVNGSGMPYMGEVRDAYGTVAEACFQYLRGGMTQGQMQRFEGWMASTGLAPLIGAVAIVRFTPPWDGGQ